MAQTIQLVSTALAALLQAEGLKVVHSSPIRGSSATDAEDHVSLWLYLISDNEHGRNPPPTTRISAPLGGQRNLTASSAFPDAVVNLYFLVTPLTRSELTDQDALDKVLHAFHTKALIRVNAPVGNGQSRLQELRITPCRLALEELTRIWDALREPYRLSVCYEVRALHIPAAADDIAAVVVEQSGGFGNLALGALDSGGSQHA